nr:hypothetical protein [Paenibacillus terrae]
MEKGKSAPCGTLKGSDLIGVSARTGEPGVRFLKMIFRGYVG